MKKLILKLLITVPLLLLVVAGGGAWWLLYSDNGSRWVLERATAGLEDVIDIGSMEGSLSGGLVLGDVRLEAGGQEIHAQRASVRVGLGVAPVTITLNDLVVEQVEIQPMPGSGGSGSVEDEPMVLEDVLEELVLPVRLVIDAGQVRSLALRDADGAALLEIDQLDLSTNWQKNIEQLKLAAAGPGIVVEAAGRIDLENARTHELVLRGEVDGSRFHEAAPPDLVLDAEIRGDGNTAELNVSSAQAGLALSGRLQALLSEPEGSFDVQLESWALPWPEDESSWLRGIAGQVSVANGRIDADLAGGLEWPGFEIVQWSAQGEVDEDSATVHDLQASTSFAQVTGNGRYGWGDEPDIQADLAWSGLAWPPDKDEPNLTSERGSARLTGLPEDWTLAAAFDLRTPQYPGGEFEITGQGDFSTAQIELHKAAALGGEWAGEASLDWSGELRVASRLSVKNGDLSAVLPDWPARLDLLGQVDYQAGEDSWIDADIERLEGSYNDHPVSGSGGLRWENDALTLRDVDLQSGASWVRGDGSTKSPEGLAVSLDIRKSDWLGQLVGGNMEGVFRFTPLHTIPVSELDLQVTDFDREDLSADRLHVRLVDVQGETGRLMLSGTGLRLGEQELDLEEAVIDYSHEALTGRVTVAAMGLTLNTSFDGEIGSWSDFAPQSWDGLVNNFVLSHGTDHLLTLEEPAPLSVNGEQIDFRSACLAVIVEGRFCINELQAGAVGLEAAAAIHAVPLNLARRVVETDYITSQYLDGSMAWSQTWGQKPSGYAAIDISAGEFGEEGDEDGMIETGAGFIGFEMTKGNLTAGQFDIPFPGAGEIDVDFSITGVAMDGTGQLSGRASLDFPDLSILDGISTYFDNIQGDLDSELVISGPVASPLMDGNFSLSGAGVGIPLLGARISDIEVSGSVEQNDRSVLNGTFRMGEGRGNLEIRSEFSDLLNPSITVQLTGDQLRAATLNDLMVDVTPDLALELLDGRWQISGTLDIPNAEISPATSFVTKATESEDLVVVAGVKTPVREASATDKLVLGGAMTVRLGENVRVEADIASVGLTGEVDLAWRGPLMPFARGTIRVNGEVTAWGPLLRITNGRVRWQEVTAANPSLDIRAERDVFGNTMIRTAGVRVAGTARRPDVEAFTNPLTTRQRAWAVLITGSDVNFGQGVGALDIGTYIAPRIFLSYGISLFDNDNVVGIRYDLKKGWGVKATSGQRETGIDVSYTIESDLKEMLSEKPEESINTENTDD